MSYDFWIEHLSQLIYGPRTYNKFMALHPDLTSYNLSKFKLTLKNIFKEIGIIVHPRHFTFEKYFCLLSI